MGGGPLFSGVGIFSPLRCAVPYPKQSDCGGRGPESPYSALELPRCTMQCDVGTSAPEGALFFAAPLFWKFREDQAGHDPGLVGRYGPPLSHGRLGAPPLADRSRGARHGSRALRDESRRNTALPNPRPAWGLRPATDSGLKAGGKAGGAMEVGKQIRENSMQFRPTQARGAPENSPLCDVR